ANTVIGSDLLNGTYKVALLSGANGLGTAFQDLSGNALDGNGDGNNGDPYIHSFPVAVPTQTVVVSIPSFARGPDAAAADSINLANSAATNGIPVTLGLPPGSGSVAGITSVKFVLSYNNTMLTVSGADTVTGAGIVPATDSPSFTLLASSTLGT